MWGCLAPAAACEPLPHSVSLCAWVVRQGGGSPHRGVLSFQPDEHQAATRRVGSPAKPRIGEPLPAFASCAHVGPGGGDTDGAPTLVAGRHPSLTQHCLLSSGASWGAERSLGTQQERGFLPRGWTGESSGGRRDTHLPPALALGQLVSPQSLISWTHSFSTFSSPTSTAAVCP